MASRNLKPPIEPFQYARNGKYPDASFQAEIGALASHLTLFRLKEIARFNSNMNAVAAKDGSAERVRWRSAWLSSPTGTITSGGTPVIMAKAYLAQTNPDSALAPYARVRIQTGMEAGGTPATLGDITLSYGAAPTASSVPDDCATLTGLCLSGGAVVSPSPDTEYYFTISDFNYARIVSISVYEAVQELPTFNTGWAQGTPIFDEDRHDPLSDARLMWKQQAAHLFNWSVDKDGSARTRSSATHINIIDNSSTSVAASSPGFTLDLRNRSTVRRSTVPVVFKAYCSVAAGSGGSIKLKDSGGTAVATLASAGGSGAGWYSTTADLPATLAKYDITYAGDGTNTISVFAVSAYQWASGS